jgi:hypothetical protein
VSFLASSRFKLYANGLNWLLRELVDLKLRNDGMKNNIIANNDSVQAIPEIPVDVKAIYKTIREMVHAATCGVVVLPEPEIVI